MARPQGLKGAGNWWHFGSHDELLARYPDLTVHVPIRNPLDVAASWAQRDKAGDAEGRMLTHFRAMWRFLDAQEHRHSLYRMEDLPRTKGTGEHVAGEWSEKIALFQALALEHVVRPHIQFYSTLYPI